VLSSVRAPSTAPSTGSWPRARPGARIVTTVRYLGFDPHRYEVLLPRILDEWTLRAALDSELVVARADELPPSLAGLRRLAALDPAHPSEGPALVILGPTLPPDVVFDGVTVDPSWLLTSGESNGGAALCDGDPETVFRSSEEEAWIEVSPGEPLALSRIDLTLAADVVHPPKVRALVQAEDGAWTGLPLANSRVAPDRQLDVNGPRSQRWLPLAPVAARRYRLILERRAGADWAIAEIGLARVGLPLDAAP